ncbi:MAG: asparagine--tRNA ligase [Burkholderiales bacterium]|nr:asparagine--tRNA ligase [Burkholderiales bacterium]
MTVHSVKQLLLTPPPVDTKVQVRGWVRSRRDSKAGISFINLSDGSCFNTIQIVVQNSLANYNEIIRLTKDCSLIVTGTIVNSLGEGQQIEILAETIDILGIVENPDSYPVSPKRHTVEYLREVAHLRVRTNLIAAVTRIRNTVSYAIHEYLQSNGFFWIHTPLITGADAEGAGELFKVTTLNLNNVPKDENGLVDYKQDFFGRETFLTVSGQLNAEAYCLGMSKVYTFGPTFRAENSNTTRHLAEFWMVEPEIAFANLMDNAHLATALLKHVFKSVLDKNSDDMAFFAQFINKDAVSRLEQLVNQEFAMISYTEAVEYLLKSNKAFENPVHWGIDLASEHERWICEELMAKPTIVTDYPRDIKAFYMRQNEDGKTVAAMDILAPGVGEIVGGAAREERYDVLVKRMQEMGMSQDSLYWYLDLRRFGTVPHAGFGVGLERLISYITSIQNVRDVIAFPRTSKSANF